MGVTDHKVRPCSHACLLLLMHLPLSFGSSTCLGQAVVPQPHAYVQASDRDARAGRQLLEEALLAVRGLSLSYWQDPTPYLKRCFFFNPFLQKFLNPVPVSWLNFAPRCGTFYDLQAMVRRQCHAAVETPPHAV